MESAYIPDKICNRIILIMLCRDKPIFHACKANKRIECIDRVVSSTSFSHIYIYFHFYFIKYYLLCANRLLINIDLYGWFLWFRRYYFSLFLELSDIAMPLIRAVISKVSDAISFFLVCLIGRSLGLIYTGIRQSLRWK